MQAISGDLPLQPALLDKMLTTIDAADRALAKRNWRNVGTLSLQVHQHIVAQLGSRLLNEYFLTLCAQLRLVFASEIDESLIQTADWIERERLIHGLLVKNRRAEAAEAMAAYLDDSGTHPDRGADAVEEPAGEVGRDGLDRMTVAPKLPND